MAAAQKRASRRIRPAPHVDERPGHGDDGQYLQTGRQRDPRPDGDARGAPRRACHRSDDQHSTCGDAAVQDVIPETRMVPRRHHDTRPGHGGERGEERCQPPGGTRAAQPEAGRAGRSKAKGGDRDTHDQPLGSGRPSCPSRSGNTREGRRQRAGTRRSAASATSSAGSDDCLRATPLRAASHTRLLPARALNVHSAAIPEAQPRHCGDIRSRRLTSESRACAAFHRCVPRTAETCCPPGLDRPSGCASARRRRQSTGPRSRSWQTGGTIAQGRIGPASRCRRRRLERRRRPHRGRTHVEKLASNGFAGSNLDMLDQ